MSWLILQVWAAMAPIAARIRPLAMLVWVASVASASQVDTRALDAQHFSLGWVGFVGHISDAELAMNLLGERKDADLVFSSIIEDPRRPVVAKLYALCGLKKIGSPNFDQSAQRLAGINEKVPTLRVDILRSEDARLIVRDIVLYRCNRRK